jgi:predicted 3-demethylubiquinone-9 3-methyltransferase (glyoxalase superfamily)
MQKITTFLWFDDQAEEAVEFYTSLFKDSAILETQRYGEAGPRPAGSVITMRFTLAGQEYVALNGGPNFKFNPAISLQVNCETQAEVDWLWQKLTDGGEESMCGWLVDKYGLSWQIVPAGLLELLFSPDAEKSTRATQAMYQMKKLDIEKIRQAYEGVGEYA